MKSLPDEKRHGAKEKSAPPKGKIIPDSKPENDFKKSGKKAMKSRKADKK